MKRDLLAESLIDGLADLADVLEEFERITGQPVEVVTTYEIDATCPLCGTRTIYATRDPKAAGAIMAVCNRCSAGDSPTDHPDTGYLQ